MTGTSAIDQFKLSFLFRALWIGGIIIGLMGIVRIQHSLVIGSTGLGFAAIAFLLAYRLYGNPHKADQFSSIVIIIYCLFALAIFVLAPYNKTRFSLFFLLSAAVLFIKGREVGMLWVVGILLSVIVTHAIMPDSGYSNLDIITGIIHTLLLLVVFEHYEKLVRKQHSQLQAINLKLEEDVRHRTLELQEANEALHQERELLRSLSYIDQLTGLHNRHKLEEIFEFQKNQFNRHHDQFSLMIIDVDRFKEINDTLGHEVGDIILKEVANVLKNNSRKSDLVARWGGDEFVVIATKTNMKQMVNFAEAIRSHVEKISCEALNGGKISASIGVSTIASDDTLPMLLRRADDALYESKRAGRNLVRSRYL